MPRNGRVRRWTTLTISSQKCVSTDRLFGNLLLVPNNPLQSLLPTAAASQPAKASNSPNSRIFLRNFIILGRALPKIYKNRRKKIIYFWWKLIFASLPVNLIQVALPINVVACKSILSENLAVTDESILPLKGQWKLLEQALIDSKTHLSDISL